MRDATIDMSVDSACLNLSLSTSLSEHLSDGVSVCLYVPHFFYLYVRTCLCMPVYLFFYPYISFSICRSLHSFSICISVFLSVCLFVCISLFCLPVSLSSQLSIIQFATRPAYLSECVEGICALVISQT